jgi:hypothetical protein
MESDKKSPHFELNNPQPISNEFETKTSQGKYSSSETSENSENPHEKYFWLENRKN